MVLRVSTRPVGMLSRNRLLCVREARLLYAPEIRWGEMSCAESARHSISNNKVLFVGSWRD